MNFRDTPAERAFRARVRSFAAANLPSALQRGEIPDEERVTGPAMTEWRRAVASVGWVAPHWPTELGGGGLSVGEQFILNEEFAEARAPEVGGMAVQHIGPVLIRYGTDEQRREHLGPIARGETLWCQGYSEPGAGSDLASLQTSARRDGDEFILTGQKIWTSNAHRTDWMFLLARTDRTAPKHRGISMFLLDLKTPGITVRSLISLAGDHVFNEVFFDDVHIPAGNLVGEENRGWYVGAALLDFERSNIARAIALKHMVHDLTGQAAALRRTTLQLRHELSERAVEAEVSRLMSYRVISIQKRGGVPNYEASMNKIFRSETHLRIANTGVRLLGMHANLYRGSASAPLIGRFGHTYLAAAAVTIAGGTSEINRNVIATRGLGLPRS